jgi:hypothetical protein
VKKYESPLLKLQSLLSLSNPDCAHSDNVTGVRWFIVSYCAWLAADQKSFASHASAHVFLI